MFSLKFCPQIELHNQLHPRVGHQAPERLFCEITNKSALIHKISFVFEGSKQHSDEITLTVSKRTNIESHAV
jgi:hypothetical protein